MATTEQLQRVRDMRSRASQPESENEDLDIEQSNDRIQAAEMVLGQFERAKSNVTAQQSTQAKQNLQQKSEGAKGVAGFGLGAAKGAGSTAFNIGNMGQSVLDNTIGRVISAASGDGFTKPVNQGQELAGQAIQESLKPVGTAEKAGFVTEQIGEFFVPGGAGMKAAKAAEAAMGTSKLAKATGLATRVLTEGSINAAQTASQGGDSSDIKKSGIIGMALPAVSKSLSQIISKLPESSWANVLKRTSKQVTKNPNLPKQAAETGLVGSKESIVKQSQKAIQAIEFQLDDLLEKSGKKVDGQAVAGYLQDLKETYKNIPGESYAVNILGTLQQEVREKGLMTVKEANVLKRNIYQVIEDSYGKGNLDVPGKTAGQKIIASGLKQEIEKVIPEVKKLNEKQAVYVQMKKAIERQLSQGEGRGIAGVRLGGYDLLAGGLGTIAGVAGGTPLAGVAIVGGKKIIESPVTQTAVAKMAKYFDNLSPTKKTLFYNALRGLTTKTTLSVSNSLADQKEQK
jgi:hypothetical protein